jgi:CRISPR/Cas system CSM-associated protein Csm2 small subunit
MANSNPSKNSKKLLEIAVQIGRNQSVQHCTANFLRKTLPTKLDRIEGEKPTKSEFLSLLWDEIVSLVSDISEHVECDETEIKITTEKPNPRKKLF